MESKKTNLCVAADITSSQKLLEFVSQIGSEICMLKTHVDILEDFSQDFVRKLSELAKLHNFLIFEDRKFADIGNTVKTQYEGGIYKISDWADITNSHVICGASSIASLKEVGLPKGRGLLLLAQISTADAITNTSTVSTAISIANQHSDFVFGFVSQERLATSDHEWVYCTPGVNISVKGDSAGQNYNTPHHVIAEKKTDVIIVGRGIVSAENPLKSAQEYRLQGWEAYMKRCTQN